MPVVTEYRVYWTDVVDLGVGALEALALVRWAWETAGYEGGGFPERGRGGPWVLVADVTKLDAVARLVAEWTLVGCPRPDWRWPPPR